MPPVAPPDAVSFSGSRVFVAAEEPDRAERLAMGAAHLAWTGTRERGGGGGVVGATCPHNFEAVGAPPPTLDRQCRYLCLFLHANFGLSQKNSGPNPGSL